MANETGTFCWNELMTGDVDRSRGFYTELFGWKAETSQMGPIRYTMFKNGGAPLAGMMAAEKGVPPHWLTYVSVDKVDERADRARALGGEVLVPPMDVPNVGRFAVLKDPTGAAFAIITLAKH